MKVLRIIAVGIGALAVLGLVVYYGARFGDGPLGMIPGGAIASGEWVEAPVADWSFVDDVQEIEFQLVQDDISRTVWVLHADGRAFVPASLSFPPGKDWYHRAQKDGRSVLRIEGRRYPVTLRRVDDDATKQAVVAAVVDKYAPPPGSGEGNVMFFEVSSRPR
jgi:hypothetical protein